MRFADVSFATACFVQLLVPGWSWPQPDGQPHHELPALSAYGSEQLAAISPQVAVITPRVIAAPALYRMVLTTGTGTGSSPSSTQPPSSTYSTGGVTFKVQQDTNYQGTLLNILKRGFNRKRAASDGIDACMDKCANSTMCSGTAYDRNSSMCTYYSSVDRSTEQRQDGITFANVENRNTNSSGNGTTAASSSTYFKSLDVDDSEQHIESPDDYERKQHIKPTNYHEYEYEQHIESFNDHEHG
ncbi:hypothetical protein E4T47_06982 [Aureobasidium subglaciale]|nr:hypothetical protein E4T43_02516 [Aureobasidium subglaciale]KAI5269494.1 hypothetical protein E4T47_06982 [Aureobasidium subglaciale]